jgi:hypothetical protein
VFFAYTNNIKGELTDEDGKPVQPTAPSFYKWFGSYGLSYETPRRTFYIEARDTIFPKALNIRPIGTDERGTYVSATQKWDLTARYRSAVGSRWSSTPAIFSRRRAARWCRAARSRAGISTIRSMRFPSVPI